MTNAMIRMADPCFSAIRIMKLLFSLCKITKRRQKLNYKPI